MTYKKAITILTEEIEDHLPEEKWQDYEDALTVMLNLIEQQDAFSLKYQHYKDDGLAYTD